jgi:hypothetical protein
MAMASAMKTERKNKKKSKYTPIQKDSYQMTLARKISSGLL